MTKRSGRTDTECTQRSSKAVGVPHAFCSFCYKVPNACFFNSFLLQFERDEEERRLDLSKFESSKFEENMNILYFCIILL